MYWRYLGMCIFRPAICTYLSDRVADCETVNVIGDCHDRAHPPHPTHLHPAGYVGGPKDRRTQATIVLKYGYT